MLNKEDILALAWGYSEGSGKRYTFTEESLFAFLKELKKEPVPAQAEQQPVGVVLKVPGEDWNSVDFRIDLQSLPAGTKLYAAPIAQTDPQPEQGGLVDMVRLALHNGQLVPDPEMDGSTEVFGIKIDDMEALEATLSAQETNKI